MVKKVGIHRKQYGYKIKCIPLSANIVGRRIENIAEDLKKLALELRSVGGFL